MRLTPKPEPDVSLVVHILYGLCGLLDFNPEFNIGWLTCAGRTLNWNEGVREKTGRENSI